MGFIEKRIRRNEERIRDNERVLSHLQKLKEIKSNKNYKEILLCQIKNQREQNARYILLYKSHKYAIMFKSFINNLKTLWEKETKKDSSL